MDSIILVAILAVVSLPIGSSTVHLINHYLDDYLEYNPANVAAFSLAWFLMLVLACVPATLG